MLIPKVLQKLSKNPQICFIGVKHLSQSTTPDLVIEELNGTDKGIVILGLNGIKNRNSIGDSFLRQLHRSVDQINQNKPRVLIIRSLIPKIFCAGADLKERLLMPGEAVAPFVSRIRNLMTKISNLPMPVIAAMDGAALGGGLELGLASDLRVAAKETKLGLVETKWGIIPGAGGSQRLPRLINPALAKELIYTARMFDGAYAEDIGLVNYAVPQNEHFDAAYQKSLELAREILPNGPVGVEMAKRAIDKGAHVDLNTGLVIEDDCSRQLVPTQDRIEGLLAFKEKRKPKFTGK